MLNLPKLRKFAKELVQNSQGVILNTFLLNRQNQIIVMVKGTKQDPMILSSLLGDSQYVIQLNIYDQQEIKQQQPLEVVAQFQQNFAYLYSLESNFIFGTIVDKKRMSIGHKMSTDASKTLKRQLQNVVQWLNKDPI